MMKCRFRACLFPLFTGEHGLISLTTNSDLLNRCFAARPFTNFQLKGIGRLNQSLHSCADEEDDFSELGPSVEKSVGALPILMTAKREPLKLKSSFQAEKCQNQKASPLAPESIKKLKDIFLKQTNGISAPRLKPENNTNAFCPNLAKKNASNLKSSTSVTIENVPSIIQLHQLKKAVSIFGEISIASMRIVPNGLDCCDIEFESVKSRNRALSDGWITVKKFNLPIHPLHVLDIVSIRISNISSETDDSSICSLCMSCGPLEGMVRCKDVVDASFSMKDKSDTLMILKKLNQIIADDCNWSACLQTEMPTSVAMNKDNNADWHLGLKVISQIDELKRQISMTRVLAEDLEHLHHVVTHFSKRKERDIGSYCQLESHYLRDFLETILKGILRSYIMRIIASFSGQCVPELFSALS
ncbi:unnamed protein product [Dovyalis caffra]|uniref:Uncharacterized protein n=1 Tax=Dovyalis caffra TaxID=77055 RepID=A0AAV1SAA2_9ROSI|nr:unnamed protein product [Dovyalis caffra]